MMLKIKRGVFFVPGYQMNLGVSKAMGASLKVFNKNVNKMVFCRN